MASGDSLRSPVVIDAVVSEEKLHELLALETEYPELDFKRTLDLKTTKDRIELAKDVGAMQVKGGYVVLGVDDHGKPTGELDLSSLPSFDEARLTPQLRKYLPEPLEIRNRAFDLDGKSVVLIYVGPHPDGCSIFSADGKYSERGREVLVFRAGDVFWRDGTRSVRLTQEGLREIIRRQVDLHKVGWIAEQQELRRADVDMLQAGYESRRLAEAPLGALSVEVDSETLVAAAIELLRKADTIPLRQLLFDSVERARAIFEKDEFEVELGDLLDKLTCLASAFLRYGEMEWFARVVETMATIYDSGLDDVGRHLDYSTSIQPAEKRTRLWLVVIERVFALGALAVRVRNWAAVRLLTLERPERLDRYHTNWLRHALTMAARAQHLVRSEGAQQEQISLLTLARQHIERLECLRGDRIGADADEALTSLAEFDILSNLAAIGDAKSVDTSVFYTSFARFRNERVEPIITRLLEDEEMRKTLFPLNDDDLAVALRSVNERAAREGYRFAGFYGFRTKEITDFLAKHPPTRNTG